jgi:hypothetical protein
LQQAQQFIKEIFFKCLEKDMKTCKIQSLEMTQKDVIKKMLNTIFITNIQGTL